MAAPTVTSITPNGGPVTGGTSVTIAGTGFTGATSASIGGFNLTSLVVVSATEITGKTANTYSSNLGTYTSGAQQVAVTTPEGTGELGAGENRFVYWAPQTVRREGGRQYETITLGLNKTASVNAVSYGVEFAGSENKFFPLLGNYAQPDYFEIELVTGEASGTLTLKAFLESSLDGGATWEKVEGTPEPEVTAASTQAVKGAKLEEKPFGPILRLALKNGAAAKAVVKVIVATSHK